MMIQMLMATGGSFVVNDLTLVSVDGFGQSFATALANYRDDGRITDVDDRMVDNWGSPTTSGAGAAYWVRATLISGATPDGSALNTWHQMSTNPFWSITRNGDGITWSNLNIQIASDSGGSNILDTHTLELTAEVSSL